MRESVPGAFAAGVLREKYVPTVWPRLHWNGTAIMKERAVGSAGVMNMRCWTSAKAEKGSIFCNAFTHIIYEAVGKEYGDCSG